MKNQENFETPTMTNHENHNKLGKDFMASLVVMLVALPLALGIALASGAPLLSGLIACVVGGIVAGLIAGAPLQVSGPAAGLVVVVYGFIEQFGWQVTCAITLCAGLVQAILGFARIGRICLAISTSVVHGMLAGIGLVIVLAQIHVIFGGAPSSSTFANIIELPSQILNINGAATLIGIATIGIIVLWQYMPRRVKAIPSALVAVVATTAASVFLNLNVDRVVLPDNVLGAIALPAWPESAQLGAFLIAVLTLTIVASVESLLCAVATDKLHRGKRANLDRELVGQGASNLVSGLIGGLPVTGVIVRSTANISAGAQTSKSAIMHGVWIALFVLAFSNALEVIPLAALAGLLVHVGIKLINLNQIRQMLSSRQLVIYSTTFLAVAFWNLLAGVALGIAMSIFFLVLRLAKTEICVETRDGKWHVLIEGSLTFISVPELVAALESVPQGAQVEVDLMVDFMDHAALDALHMWRVSYENAGGKVDIDELHERWKDQDDHWKPIVVKQYNQKAFMSESTGVNPRIESIFGFLSGVSRFQNSNSRWKDSLFPKLAKGQNPNILFVGCADSRVVPSLITNTKPGEMFTMQNVGNLIPPYPEASVGATLDYAIEVLKVEHIMICGHSDCGAMKALSGVGPLPSSENVQTWVKNAKTTLELFDRIQVEKDIINLDNNLPKQDQVSQVNVLQQLKALGTYPSVQKAMQEGKLQLWGMFFSIADAQLYVYDQRSCKFVTVDDLMIGKSNVEKLNLAAFIHS